MKYSHVVEGMMGLTGYYAWHKTCVGRRILPGMQQLIRRIGDYERRRMASSAFTCRCHVAADDANWTLFETRMNAPSAGAVPRQAIQAIYGEALPVDLSPDELRQYSADRGWFAWALRACAGQLNWIVAQSGQRAARDG